MKVLFFFSILTIGTVAGCAKAPPGTTVRAELPATSQATAEPWGTVVGGLQARLSADRHEVAPLEEFRLRVEVRNVTDRVINIRDIIPFWTVCAPGEWPHRSEAAKDYRAFITAEPLGVRINVSWRKQQSMVRQNLIMMLKPGATQAIDIDVPDPRQKEVARRALERPERQDDPLQTSVRFAYHHGPAVYRFVYRLELRDAPTSHEDAAVLTSNAIDITVRAP